MGSGSDRGSGVGRGRAASEARGLGRSRRLNVRDGATTTERDRARRRWDGTHILDVPRVCIFHGGYGSPRVAARESTPPGIAWVSRGSLWGSRWSTFRWIKLFFSWIPYFTAPPPKQKSRNCDNSAWGRVHPFISAPPSESHCTARRCSRESALGTWAGRTLCLRVEPWRTLPTRTGERARPPTAGSPPARSSSRSSSPSPVRIPPSSPATRRAFSPAGRLPSRIPDLSTPRSLPGADVFSTFKDASQDAQSIAPTTDQRSLGGKVHISFCQS